MRLGRVLVVLGAVSLLCCEDDPAATTVSVPSTLSASCIRVLACAPEAAYASVGQCLLQSQRLPGIRTGTDVTALDVVVTAPTCLNAANGDCAKVRSCITGHAGACGDAESVHCEGPVLVRCGADRARYEVDCRTAYSSFHDVGATCVTAADGTLACGFATCSPGEAARCEGDVLVSCENGVVRRKSCNDVPAGTSPRHCVSSAVAHCAFDGPACTGSGRHCDATTLVTCDDGNEARINCASATIPSGCGNRVATKEPECMPLPSLACDPANYQDSCEGSHLVYCDGSVRAADCTALGFRGCRGGVCVSD